MFSPPTSLKRPTIFSRRSSECRSMGGENTVEGITRGGKEGIQLLEKTGTKRTSPGSRDVQSFQASQPDTR